MEYPRHSFASCDLAFDQTLPVIAKLLCRSDIETTSRYGHPARDSTGRANGIFPVAETRRPRRLPQ